MVRFCKIFVPTRIENGEAIVAIDMVTVRFDIDKKRYTRRYFAQY